MENLKKFCKDKSIDFFFPIALVLGIIPLIVRMAVVHLDATNVDFYGVATQTDLFSQKKAFYLLIFSIILVIIGIVFFKKIFEKRDKIINLILIASGVFILFTILSAVFSKYNQAAFWGAYDRAEGLITIICYMILFIYSIYTFKKTDNYKYLVVPIIILVIINSFLGIFQYFGHDLIKTELGKTIVIPSKYRTPNMELSLLYEAGKLYGTLFHYNYVGSFVAICLPILLCAIAYEYDVAYKLSLMAAVLLSVWLLFGSTSRAGIIGIFMSIVFAVIIFWKIVVKKWKPILIGLVSVLVVCVGLNLVSKGSLFERIPSLISDTFSVFKDTSDFNYKDHIPVKDIKTSDKTVEIIFQNDSLKIALGDGQYIFKNSKDEVIEFDRNKNILTTTNEAFKNVSFSFGKLSDKSTRSDGLLMLIDGKETFMFKLQDDNSLHLIDPSTQKDIILEDPETIGFKGKEKLGSMRGYIWARSLPLLKENLILGSGPDSFIYRFPQNDLLGKYYAYEDPNTVVDKPHNLYLQIALNEGLIALIAFLAIMIIYIVDSLKLYAFKNEYDKSQIIGIGTCLGVIGYLFAGIFNDSVVSVAPVFWIVLGVGVAINYLNRKDLKKENSNK